MVERSIKMPRVTETKEQLAQNMQARKLEQEQERQQQQQQEQEQAERMSLLERIELIEQHLGIAHENADDDNIAGNAYGGNEAGSLDGTGQAIPDRVPEQAPDPRRP